MHFFGPSDTMSQHWQLMRWKVKMATNDDMRQQFLTMYVPKIWNSFNHTRPRTEKDPETGKWQFGDPDWNEFFEVIKRQRRCNSERIAVRKAAERNGAWVRAALRKADEHYTIPLA